MLQINIFLWWRKVGSILHLAKGGVLQFFCPDVFQSDVFAQLFALLLDELLQVFLTGQFELIF